MTPRLAFLAMLAAAGGGCLIGDVGGIPCTADDECPSDGFCDLHSAVCVESAEGGAPDVKIVAVEGADGKPRAFTSVPIDVDTTILVHLENEGGFLADDISVSLSWLRCAPMHLDPATVPQHLDAGELARMTLELHVARDCINPVPVDWFVRFSGREHRGVFELFHVIER